MQPGRPSESTAGDSLVRVSIESRITHHSFKGLLQGVQSQSGSSFNESVDFAHWPTILPLQVLHTFFRQVGSSVILCNTGILKTWLCISFYCGISWCVNQKNQQLLRYSILLGFVLVFRTSMALGRYSQGLRFAFSWTSWYMLSLYQTDSG